MANMRTIIRMTATHFDIRITNRETGEVAHAPLVGKAVPYSIRDKKTGAFIRRSVAWDAVKDDEKSRIAKLLCELHGIEGGTPKAVTVSGTHKRRPKPKKLGVKAAVGVLVDNYVASTEWERPEHQQFLGRPAGEPVTATSEETHAAQ